MDAAYLSQVAWLLMPFIVVAAGIHRLLLDLGELRLVRVLKHGLHSAVVNVARHHLVVHVLLLLPDII